MRRKRGFTLIEMIVAISITGIVAAMVAVFIKPALDSYFATARRAWLTDVADTALRRIARDVQAALPNSLRPSTACQASTAQDCGLELLLTTTGGRYQQDTADSWGCFTYGATGGCTSLTTLGSVIKANGELVGQHLVIYNLHNNENDDCSPTYPSAYCDTGRNNRATITNSVNQHPSSEVDSDGFGFAKTAFQPAAGSPARAFFVVSGPVAYVCSNVGVDGNGNGTGELRRFWGYPILTFINFPPDGPNALLAHRVSACGLNYAPNVVGTLGILELYLEVMEAGERVGLYHTVHVDNAP